MACQRYRKLVFIQKNVIVKKKWGFGPTEGQAVLFRVAEMQSFAAVGNVEFTCKGKALQIIVPVIPSLRAAVISSLERSAKSSIQEEPMCRQGSNDCQQGHEGSGGTWAPGSWCSLLHNTCLLEEKQHFQALIWLSENF